MHYDIKLFSSCSQVVVVGGDVIGIVINPDFLSAWPSYRSLTHRKCENRFKSSTVNNKNKLALAWLKWIEKVIKQIYM